MNIGDDRDRGLLGNNLEGFSILIGRAGNANNVATRMPSAQQSAAAWRRYRASLLSSSTAPRSGHHRPRRRHPPLILPGSSSSGRARPAPRGHQAFQAILVQSPLHYVTDRLEFLPFTETPYCRPEGTVVIYSFEGHPQLLSIEFDPFRNDQKFASFQQLGKSTLR